MEEGGAGSSTWEKGRLEGQNTYLILARFCFEYSWKTKNWFVTSINC